MFLATPLPGLRRPVTLTRSTVTPSCSMEESDGTCSLRLREPCEWDGKMYAAVVPVDTLPVLSGAALQLLHPCCRWAAASGSGR